MLPCLLKGPAEQLFDELTMDDKQTFEKMSKELAEKLQTDAIYELCAYELHGRVQREDESVTEYAASIRRLAAKAYKNMDMAAKDEFLARIFEIGLQRSIRETMQVAQTSPSKTLAESEKLARRIEVMLAMRDRDATKQKVFTIDKLSSPRNHINENDYHQSTTERTNNNTRRDYGRSSRTQENYNQSDYQNQRRPRGSFQNRRPRRTCYTCGRIGHYQAQCWHNAEYQRQNNAMQRSGPRGNLAARGNLAPRGNLSARGNYRGRSNFNPAQAFKKGNFNHTGINIQQEHQISAVYSPEENDDYGYDVDCEDAASAPRTTDNRLHFKGSMMYTIFIIAIVTSFVPIATCMLANNYRLFNKCHAGLSGYAVHIPQAVDCKPPHEQACQMATSVSMWVPRTKPVVCEATKCQIRLRKVCTSVGFFGGQGVISDESKVKSVPIEECEEALNNQTWKDMAMAMEKSGRMRSTNRTLQVKFVWHLIPQNECFEVENFITQQGRIATLDVKTMSSDIFDAGGCDPKVGYCVTASETVLWNVTGLEHLSCPFEKRFTAPAILQDKHLLFE